MSYFNSVIDNQINTDPSLYQTELFLKSTCEEYSIDYDTCTPSKEMIVSEGVIEKIIKFIKGLFKKAIALLVKIWKAIVSFAKKVWESVTRFISKIMGGSHDKERQIKIKVAFITEGFNASEKEYHSKEDIVNGYKAAIAKINAEIQKRSNENINFMKRFENNVNNVIRKEALEYVEEKVLTRTTSTTIHGISKTAEIVASQREKREGHKDFEKARNDNSAFEDDTVLQGETRMDHIAEFDMKIYDKMSLEIMKDSKNIIEQYEQFVSGKLDYLSEKYLTEKHGKSLEDQIKEASNKGFRGDTYIGAMMSDAFHLYNQGYSESEVTRFVQGTYFPEFEDVPAEKREKTIRHWVNLKLNQNKTIISCLRAMITNNSRLLEISQKTASNIATDLDKGDVESAKEVLTKNKDKFFKHNGLVFDCRSIGLGCLLFSKEVATGSEYTEKGWYRSLFNDGEKVSDYAIKQLTRYGVTVLSHGIEGAKEWTIQKVVTPGGKGPFTNVEELLDALIKEGFKRINIVSCNPGGAKLPERFAKNNKVLIKHSAKNTLIT